MDAPGRCQFWNYGSSAVIDIRRQLGGLVNSIAKCLVKPIENVLRRAMITLAIKDGRAFSGTQLGQLCPELGLTAATTTYQPPCAIPSAIRHTDCSDYNVHGVRRGDKGDATSPFIGRDLPVSTVTQRLAQIITTA